MPPRLNLTLAFRALSLRATAAAAPPAAGQPLSQKIAAPLVARRFYSDNLTPNDSSSSQIPSSELPPSSLTPTPTEQFHDADAAAASVRQQQQQQKQDNLTALNRLEMVAYGLNPFDAKEEGHKYGLPSLPLPSELHKDHRYDDVMGQITRLLMKDGKLSKAQRDMAMILNYLRTSPPPKLNPLRPLIPGAPAPHFLPLDPVTYLRVAIDSVAPLVKIRGFRGMAGGGRSLEVPAPLAARQRRRTGFMWILDVVQKKKSKGSGRKMFPTRVAEEIVAVVEGRSTVWDKRAQVHKLGTAARANLMNPQIKNFL
ncbi:ribosomal protein S7 domain-containing protein [Apiosordaria backusii]|uniref:Small ribosomal subunit protein uS7m n=1 Tax=Apiosordaria backusii TaxID=314023 RepID=A0AA39ZV69_9PEZI|nr:ribosomal protein S7 domain-containing protein [Apiosordaria backusii]